MKTKTQQAPEESQSWSDFFKTVNFSQSNTDYAKYQCLKCSETQYELDDIKRHVRVKHLNENEEKCEICGETYKNGSNLQRHISACKKFYGKFIKQISNNLFECLKCPTKHVVKSGLYTHIRNKHFSGIKLTSIEVESENNHNVKKNCEVCKEEFIGKLNF